MFSFLTFGLLLCLVPFISSLTLQPSQRRSAQNAAPSFSPNHTISNPSVLCDPTLYGSNLDLISCTQAFSRIPWKHVKHELSFGSRGTGEWDVSMPYRSLSCTFMTSRKLVAIFSVVSGALLISCNISVADGHCAIDILSAYFDSCSGISMATAALQILDSCVAKPGNLGGIMIGVGTCMHCPCAMLKVEEPRPI